MSYFDSLSLFSDNFEQRVADPAELGRQLFAHRMEADYIREAIVELGTVAQFKTRARKLTPAAKTLAGETAISWLFGVGGRASWGEFELTVKRAHKMAGNRNSRVLRQLEDAGVIVCTYHGRDADRLVTVSLSYDLWLPAEIIPALPEAATTHELMRAENTQSDVAGVTPAEATAELDRRELPAKRAREERESFLAELDAAGVVPGARVEIAGSYEGGELLSLYRGSVFAIRPSGTVIVDDERETDGAGTPVRHYVSRAKKITLVSSPFTAGETGAAARTAPVVYALPPASTEEAIDQLSQTGAYRRIVSDLEWLDRNVRLDPPRFAADYLGDVERQLAKLVDGVSEGTI